VVFLGLRAVGPLGAQASPESGTDQ
jgi:hypothetical protein